MTAAPEPGTVAAEMPGRAPARAAAPADLREQPPVGVRLEGLTRRYGGVLALDGLDLDVAGGEFLALLGPSGCGKTTALRAIAGFEVPDAGRVWFDRRDVTAIPPSRRDVGMVFQAYSLFPNMTVAENVAFGLRVRRRDKAERAGRAAELLELVGLADRAQRYPHQLSGGQQQRVALARALAVAPQVLLLDEPLSALDAQVRVQLRDEIRRIQLELGITTVFVTHDQAEALSVADRVGVMRAGRLEQVASPDDLYERPATAFVAGFVGTMNRIPAVLGDGDVEFLGVRREVLGAAPAAGPAFALVRPEALEVEGDPRGPGRVVTRTFSGAVTRLTVALPDGVEVQADVPSAGSQGLTPGTPVTVTPAERPALVEPADLTP
ncbi:putative spermidine/putrescine transport system ATP-binding protein [Geodermatophilus amargosae]|jgi:putative spermidine/putrescine transport system ATP-binding protein|uniref:ABC-type quaternary amine transporter n=1 Tax=Geodermatophilus amargosae TaxID=1296565 RepID=A0A1I7ALF4_9ACTN|nr:ABC transporter ATP-binding protein [Geodermatophilus amargosae]SFT75704.1 putative spermidine/putrescine transport system ATP-binding protein [Geodermatophilus amargosae]